MKIIMKTDEINTTDYIYANLINRQKNSPYNDFKNKPIGEIIHWIYVLGNLELAENILVLKDTVLYKNEPLIKYYHHPSKKIPIFHSLINPEYKYIIENQQIYMKYKYNDGRYTSNIKT